jgi:hypothetical protein
MQRGHAQHDCVALEGISQQRREHVMPKTIDSRRNSKDKACQTQMNR